MKMKSKHTKRIAISIISIISMLTFSLTNSMFIHEAHSEIEYASNISNEYAQKSTGTHSVDKYSITRSSLGSNDVTYRIDYDESGVWYWDQVKEDYVKKSWQKYQYDQWYYGPEIPLGSSGDDSWHSGDSLYSPTMTIKYTGKRPTHTIHHPAIEDDPDTEWIDESKPAWDEVIEDSWPNPLTAFKDSSYGWRQETSWNTNSNIEYTFRWDNYNSKMDSFPRLNKDWTITSKYSGDWNQSTYNHWNWTGYDYWRDPKRASTGQANKRIFVEWEISSNDVMLDSGTKDVKPTDVITQSASSLAASQTKPIYNATDSQKHSSNAPSVTVLEPKDSDWFGVNSTDYLNIGNLPLGWEYKFNADLKYIDKNNNEVTFDTFEDRFSTEKVFEGNITTWHSSDSEDSIKFGYDLYDPKNLRISDVYWTVSTSAGVVYEGASQSNHFEKTFYIPDEEQAEFNVWYEYSLSNDITGAPNPKMSAVSNEVGEVGNYYDDEIEEFEIWFDNIQDDSFVFNYYLATNNNFISDEAKINITSAKGDYVINDVTLGTHSYLIDLSDYTELDNIPTTLFTAEISSPDTSSMTSETELNTETNLIKDFSMQLISNPIIRDREASIDYVIDTTNLTDDLNYIKYNLNGTWYDLDYKDVTSTQTLNLEGLKPETVYNIYFEANTDTRNYYSNSFKFRTDRTTSIYLNENNTSVGENSASMTFEVDKVEYLDQREFTWDVIDLSDDKVLYELTDTIDTNGSKTIYADGLKPNHKYRMVINAEVEGKVIMLYSDVTTNLETNDKMNNAYLGNISKTKNGFKMGYEGKVSSVQYSLDGETWQNTTFTIDGGQIIVNGLSTNDNGYISFIVNNQMRSQSTYYDGVTSTLIVPKNKDVDSNKVVIWSLIVFILITIAISTAWGVWHVKRNREIKIEGNIWR